MKRKGLILAGGLILLLATGCSNKKEEAPSSPVMESIPVSQQDREDAQDPEPSSATTAVQGNTELQGTVVSTGDNSLVISQIFTEESEDGEVDIAWAPAPGSEDETLVNVICTADTQYEYKRVKNSGINPEDIETRAGNFSDIQKGLSLDVTGSYQGNDFYAVKVSVSEFVH